MWGTSPVPAAPAPGLPPWAPASQDLVPTTCLLPALPSSSSFASIPPSAQVGGLCVPATRSPLVAWLCLCVLCPCAVASQPSAGPRGGALPAGGAVLRLAGVVVGAARVCGLGVVPCFSLPLARLRQLFSHCVFFSLHSPFSLPSFLFSLPVCFPDNGLPLPFLQPSPFFALFFLFPPLSFPFPSLLDLSSPSFPSCPLSSSPCPLQMEKLLLPAVDLEQWYQELMAGLGTGPAAASPRSSPPPLPAKASRQLQVTPPCRSINPTVLP